MVTENHKQLESTEKALRQALAQLHHELRHIRDGLERNGISIDLEQRVTHLCANIDLCETELRQNLSQQTGNVKS